MLSFHLLWLALLSSIPRQTTSPQPLLNMSPTNTTMEEKTACMNWAVLKTYLQNKRVFFSLQSRYSLSLTKLIIVSGSPDSLGCRFVDGNQEFLKLFGEDHIFKWLPAAIAHYERNQDPCFFMEINEDLPVGEFVSRKNSATVCGPSAPKALPTMPSLSFLRNFSNC